MKANKSRVMKMAHALYQAGEAGSWSEAVKAAWKIEKEAAGEVEKIRTMLGFNHWQKGDMDRWYINADDMGLKYDTYKSGNICGAWHDGEKISNSAAYRALSCKIYVDVKGIHASGSSDWTGIFEAKASRLWNAAA